MSTLCVCFQSANCKILLYENLFFPHLLFQISSLRNCDPSFEFLLFCRRILDLQVEIYWAKITSFMGMEQEIKILGFLRDVDGILSMIKKGTS